MKRKKCGEVRNEQAPRNSEDTLLQKLRKRNQKNVLLLRMKSNCQVLKLLLLRLRVWRVNLRSRKAIRFEGWCSRSSPTDNQQWMKRTSSSWPTHMACPRIRVSVMTCSWLNGGESWSRLRRGAGLLVLCQVRGGAGPWAHGGSSAIEGGDNV